MCGVQATVRMPSSHAIRAIASAVYRSGAPSSMPGSMWQCRSSIIVLVTLYGDDSGHEALSQHPLFQITRCTGIVARAWHRAGTRLLPGNASVGFRTARAAADAGHPGARPVAEEGRRIQGVGPG